METEWGADIAGVFGADLLRRNITVPHSLDECDILLRLHLHNRYERCTVALTLRSDVLRGRDRLHVRARRQPLEDLQRA